MQKYLAYKEKRKYQLSEQYYIDKYGDIDGPLKYKEFRLKTKFKTHANNWKNTKENFILKYGEQQGLIRWNNYCDKQRYSNTFQYKQQKLNWTKQQFTQYNKSRAVTLENLIAKHGIIIRYRKMVAI